MRFVYKRVPTLVEGFTTGVPPPLRADYDAIDVTINNNRMYCCKAMDTSK